MIALFIIALGLIVFALNIYESLVHSNDVFNCCYFGLVSHVSLSGIKKKKILRPFSTTPRFFCTGLDEDYSGYFSDDDNPDLPKDNEGRALTKYRAVCEEVNPEFNSTWSQELSVEHEKLTYQKKLVEHLNQELPILCDETRKNYSKYLEALAAGKEKEDECAFYKESFEQCIKILADIDKYRQKNRNGGRSLICDNHFIGSSHPSLIQFLKDRGVAFKGQSMVLDTMESRGLTLKQISTKKTFSTLAHSEIYGLGKRKY